MKSPAPALPRPATPCVMREYKPKREVIRSWSLSEKNRLIKLFN